MEYFNGLPLLQQNDFAEIGEYIFESVLLEEQEFNYGKIVGTGDFKRMGDWENTGKYIWGFNSKVSGNTLDRISSNIRVELFFECVDKLYQNGLNTGNSRDVPIFLVFKVQPILGRVSQSPEWLPSDFKIAINIISITQYLRQLLNENPETYTIEVFKSTNCLESLHL